MNVPSVPRISPYGEEYNNFGSDAYNLNFTGDIRTMGSSGLFDTQNRELHSNQGRWISPDPAGVAAVDPSNPQTWNRYAYVANNPLSFIDPFGEDQCPDGNEADVCVVGDDPGGPGLIAAVVTGGIGGGSVGGGGAAGGGATGAANNGQPPKQQCKQKAQQQYNQGVANAQSGFTTGLKVGVLFSVIANGLAGCAVGAGIGGSTGAAATWWLGGAGAILTTPAGCGAGGLAAISAGIPVSLLSGVATGGLVYYHDIQGAQQQLQQDLQACEQLGG